METIRVQTNEKIADILNDAQKKEFRRLLSEAEAHRRGPGHGDRSGAGRQEH